MSQMDEKEDVWLVEPIPRLCVKFRKARFTVDVDASGDKFFINVCTCSQLPPPIDDLDEKGLAAVLDSSDPGSFRIPLSVGELSRIEDHDGHGAYKVDLLINEGFYELRIATSELFRSFLLLVAVDAIDKKHGVQLDVAQSIVLKNRKFIGQLTKQRIKKQPLRPLIQEVSASTLQVPSYTLLLHNGKRVEAKIVLPDVTDSDSANNVSVDVGADRLVVQSVRYRLDIFLPVFVDVNQTVCQLKISDHTLVIFMPLIFE